MKKLILVLGFLSVIPAVASNVYAESGSTKIEIAERWATSYTLIDCDKSGAIIKISVEVFSVIGDSKSNNKRGFSCPTNWDALEKSVNVTPQNALVDNQSVEYLVGVMCKEKSADMQITVKKITIGSCGSAKKSTNPTNLEGGL